MVSGPAPTGPGPGPKAGVVRRPTRTERTPGGGPPGLPARQQQWPGPGGVPVESSANGGSGTNARTSEGGTAPVPKASGLTESLTRDS